MPDPPASQNPEEILDPEEQWLAQPAGSMSSGRWLAVIVGVVVLLVGSLGGIFFNLADEEVVAATAESEVSVRDYSSAEVTEFLQAFLATDQLYEKMKSVAADEHEMMVDYYRKRHQFDVPMWKVKTVAPVRIEGEKTWLIAYYDVKKLGHYASVVEKPAGLQLQWAAMVAYGEMSWPNFAESRPAERVKMRCLLRRDDSPILPPYDELGYLSFMIESRDGSFVHRALMAPDAVGFDTLSQLPAGADHPVFVSLLYQRDGDGISSQLMIDALEHQRWVAPKSALVR